MSDSTTLTTIGDLEKKLEPLGHKQSGMPINADDWNALVATVAAILGIDRLQEDSTRALISAQFAPKDHQHLGQVTMDWLDADLRGRLGAGGTAVTMQRAIDTLQKKVDDLSGEVARLRTTNGQLQSAVDTFSVNDVDRAKALRTVGDRIDKIADVGTQVQNLGRDVAGLHGGLDEVRDLRNKLLDETGKPINVLGLRDDVRNLKDLGENFKGVDGKPLRMRDIELQLRELKDVSGVGTGLQSRFDEFSVKVDGKIADSVTVKVADARKTLADEQKNAIAAGVKSAVDTAAAAQSSAIDTRFADAEKRVSTSVTASVLKQVQDDQTPRFKAVDDKLAQIEPRVSAAANALRADIAAAVETSVRPKIANDLQATITRVSADLNGRVAATEAAFSDLKTKLPANVTNEVHAAAGELAQQLNDQVKAQVEGARKSIADTIPDAATRAAASALANLDQRIGAAVAANVGDLPGRVRTEVTAQTKTLHTDIAHEVTAQIANVNVAGQVQQAAKGMLDQVDARFAAERAQTSRDIGNTKVDLQRQIQAEAANAKTSAVAESRVAIDARFAATRIVQPSPGPRP